MRKLALAFVLLSFFYVSSFAVVNIGVSGGYASVAMTEVNKKIDFNASIYSGLSPAVTKLGNGLYGNLDLNFGFIPFINLGLRTGILYCFQGKITVDGTNFPLLPPGSFSVSETYDSILIPIMAGLGLNIGLPGIPFSINAGVYGGYGFSIVSLGYKIKVPSAGFDLSAFPIYNGGGFVMDAGIGFSFSMLPFISATLNVAYKLAKIPEVKATSDVNLGPPLGTSLSIKDKPLNDHDGNSLPIDYSGINIGVGINIGF